MPGFAEIILTIPQEEGFTYSIPAELKDVIQEGSQVVVPIGRKYVSGIVLQKSTQAPKISAEIEIKPVKDVVFSSPLVRPELMQLVKWISDYYVCHLGEAFRLIQAGINVGRSKILVTRKCQEIPEDLTRIQKKILSLLPVNRQLNLSTLKIKMRGASLTSPLLNLEKRNLIIQQYSLIRKKSIRQSQDSFRLKPEQDYNKKQLEKFNKIMGGRPTKSRAILEYLTGKTSVSFSELKEQGFTHQSLNRLWEMGLVDKETKVLTRRHVLDYQEPQEKITLTTEQQKFVSEIRAALEKNQFDKFLLHGVTGSGKTQVYIELIKTIISKNQQAIVLIPEIALTPQTLARFRHHFGDEVAVLHSRLSVAEKREYLYRIRQGEFHVVLGPRSAIFAPVNQLGLVIVDEEHEGSYKQTDSVPHYHARDVAIYRAKLNNAVVVLGSATPSFESLYNAKTGKFKYFHLKERIGARSLPRLSVVDLRDEWKKQKQVPILSDNLELKIESRLLLKEQIMILQNRRGYAPYLLCKECGYIGRCPNCDITLTYHQSNRELLCHYCGYLEPAPDTCPSCQGVDILYKGVGTQRLEEDIRQKFTDIRLLRMDQDTTAGKWGHLKILENFRSGQSDILIGTKMIAKGLDFKRVSLVGITNADQGLYFPDFRATEKVFQLLTQAAGRAGRGANNGEVVVQTLDPAHYLFKYLHSHNYLGFYEKEIQSRQNLHYPPFSRLVLIRLEGQSLTEVQMYSRSIKNFLWKANEPRTFGILGPAPSPLAKKQNLYRYQILIKLDRKEGKSLLKLKRLLKVGLLRNTDVRKWPVRLIIDVDPIEIL